MDSRVLDQVAPAWQDAFKRFVETGEAEDKFLDYVSSDPAAQHAVEQAFAGHTQALRELAAALGEGVESPPPGRTARFVSAVRQGAIYLAPAMVVVTIGLIFLVQRYTAMIRSTEASLMQSEEARFDSDRQVDLYKAQLVDLSQERDDYRLRLASYQKDPAAAQVELRKAAEIQAANQRLEAESTDLRTKYQEITAKYQDITGKLADAQRSASVKTVELEAAKKELASTTERATTAEKKVTEAARFANLFDSALAFDPDKLTNPIHSQKWDKQGVVSNVMFTADGKTTTRTVKRGVTADGKPLTDTWGGGLKTREGTTVPAVFTCFGLPESAATTPPTTTAK